MLFLNRNGRMTYVGCLLVLHLLIGGSVLFAFKKISPVKMTWKDAQIFCANQSSVLIYVATNHSEEHWTRIYYAPSHWIHVIGCFENSYVEAVKNRTSDMKSNPNVGLCQIICNQYDAFAVKSESCLCLNDLPLKEGSRSSKQCTIQCNDTNTDKDMYLRDCGGVSHYNVYRTTTTEKKYNPTDRCQAIKCKKTGRRYRGEIRSALCDVAYNKTCTNLTATFSGPQSQTGWKESLQFCKDSNAYLFGNISITDTTSACRAISNISIISNSWAWIGITGQPVLLSDQEDLEGNLQENVLQCQKCFNHQCYFTKMCDDQLYAVCEQLQNSGEEIVTDVSTLTEMESTSEKLETKSTYIMSNQQDSDTDEVIITVTVITVLLLILSLTGYCFVRKIVMRKKTHKALKPTRFNNKNYQQDDNRVFETPDALEGQRTDHYTYVEAYDTGPKAEYSEIGVYSHLRENEERGNLTGDLDVYNHLKDSEEGGEQGGDTYDRASSKKAAASDHGNSDHIYDQSCAGVYGEKETKPGLKGDEYHHTGLILTENTYDETKMSTMALDLDGEYSHTQDLQTEHVYGKVDVHSGALDDEYCHTIDIETEQAL